MALLTILLTILKTIGIVLLCILGIVLLLLAAVLFVPVRYRAEGFKKGDDIEAHVKVSWMLFVIRAAVDVLKPAGGEVSVDVLVKALFIKVFPREEKPGKPKKEKPAKKKEEKPGHAYKEEEKHSTADDFPSFDNSSDGELLTESPEPEGEEHGYDEDEEEKKSFFKKLGEFFGFIYSLPGRISEKYRDFRDNVKDKKEFIADKLELITGPGTKEGVTAVLSAAKKLILHILPRKGRCEADLGFEDPSTTGSAVAAYSVFYPFIGRCVFLNAHFDKEIMDAEFNVKGRIRIFTVLITALKLWFDKRFKALLGNLKKHGLI